MRRRWLLCTVLAALALVTSPLHFAQGGIGALLEVVAVSPAPASPLALDASITLSFNRRVDCAAAEAALRWQPPIAAAIRCDEYRLSLRPQAALSPGSTLQLEVRAPLHAKDGAALPQDFLARFRTADFLQIAEALPNAAGGAAPVDSAITLAFDKPVVPLALSSEQGALPVPISINPPIAGSGRWKNSALYVFEPDAQLQNDTLYTVTVADDLTALDGAPLAAPYSWSFRSAQPALLSLNPPPGAPDISLAPRIQMRFNQAMERDVLERAFYLSPLPASEGEPAAGAFDWADDGMGVVFTPAVPLRYDTVYEAGFNAERAPALRFSTLEHGASWRYHTVPPPAISATEPLDGATDVSRGGFTLYFASPMNSETLEDKITISPQPAIAPRVYYNEWNNSYSVAFDAQPSTAYAIDIAPGMADIYGKAISEPYSFRYRTAPRPPLLELQLPGAVGFFDANRQPPELALTHRGLQAIDLALYRIPLPDFIARLTGDDRYAPARSYSPPASQLIRRWQLPAGAPANISRSERVPLSESGADAKAPAALKPGIYFFEAQAPEIAEQYGAAKQFLNVANAALTLKQATDRLTVWAVDVATGAPLREQTITVYGRDASRLAQARTDERGIASIDIPYSPALDRPLLALLMSGEHFGIGYSGWTQGTEPWQFGFAYSPRAPAYQAYIYSDRPVYRGGQPVYFRGILRSKDDVVYMPPPLDTVPVTLRDPRGEIVYQRAHELSEFGSFHGAFDIPKDAALGAYRLSLELPAADAFYPEFAGLDFLVAEYRLPEYQVALAADSAEIVQGDSAEFTLEGRYFFGGAVSHAEVEYNVLTAPYAFDYSGAGHYEFADSDRLYPPEGPPHYGGLVTQGALRTDADGKAIFSIQGDLADAPGSQRWRVEAAIRDEAGQTLYDSADLVLHQGLFYVGIGAEKAVGAVGEQSHLNIIAVDWESQPIANQAVEIQVVERRWSRVQERESVTGRPAWSWTVEEIPVVSGAVQTGADGKADFSFRPPNGGIFKIIVLARDARGNRLRAASKIWVAGAEFVPWRQSASNAIDIVPERAEYAIGERAKLLITSPFKGETQALISIERGDVLSIEQVTLTNNSYIYEFDILPQHAPNVYVTVFLLKPADATNETAAWRLGMTQLLVENSRKALTVDISADRAQAAPGATVRYRLRVRNHAGEPARAEIGLALTDLAALSLAQRNSPPLLDAFFGPQELTVRTSSSLAVTADADAVALAEGKGGGGGILETGISALRGDFIDTPYWQPSLVTDEAGEAYVDITLPDNLTTWRLDARAWTAGRGGRLLVGEAQHDLLSTKALLIRPQTPRFFIAGDKARLSAVLHNNSGEAASLVASLENRRGLTLAAGNSAERALQLPAGGRARVDWLVEVEAVAAVAPHFVLRHADGADADASISPVSQDSAGTLPVYRFAQRETVGTAGMLRQAGARSEALLLPREYIAPSGRLSLRLDKSLAGATAESLAYLAAQSQRYQECASAIVSRFLPQIAAFRAQSQLGLADSALQAELAAHVADSLQALYARQLPAGGWGWCGAADADVMTSAYALFGLAQAAENGFPVDAAARERAQRYLRQQLIRPSLQVERWRLNRQAFLLFALAQSGAPDKASSAALFESRERLSLDAVAFLAQTLYHINPNNRERLSALAQQLQNRAIISATGTYFSDSDADRRHWSSSLRSSALALDSLLLLQPESELLPNIARYLLRQRQGRGHWNSPQETAWALIALSHWLRASGELTPTFAYAAHLNGDELWSDIALPSNATEAIELQIDAAALMQNETNLLTIQRDAGTGALYYSAHLTLDLPVEQIKPLNRGIEISRRYQLLGAPASAPITSARISDTVQVRLQIAVPNTLRYVVIEDFLPAGTEAVNPELATSSQLGTAPGGARIGDEDAGWGWQYFDRIEFRDEKAVIYASVLPKGVYEFVYTISPLIAGEYQALPPLAQELYFPEVYGRGAGARFVIEE